MEKSNILVVYFSRSGITKKVALAILKGLNCDIDEITEEKKRNGFLGFMKSGFQAFFKKCPQINEPGKDPSLYDRVIIGGPTWAGNMSSPVRTYLNENSEKFKKVAFFCSRGGTKVKKLFNGMKEICGKDPIAELIVNQKEVKEKDDGYGEKIEKFIKEINQ
ncbi:MAG: flavodoxin family protein [Promethearchaeota archaeon]